ncbi:MAG: endonuclease III [Planctomycetota bacterium]
MIFSTSHRARRSRAATIADRLAEAYPDAGCALEVRSPLQVLVATILSAQCTDAKVNQVTPALFDRYPTLRAFAEAERAELEEQIRPIGLHKGKAKNIIAACRRILEAFDGTVPETIDELVTLPGVGRKTANCVLVNAHGKPGLMTDTHFCRIVQRLGLTDASDPAKIEAAIADLLPPERWGAFSHQIIRHGRACCTARKPHCGRCPLQPHCETGRRR